MFKKKKENKIIETNINFRTTDPSIEYIRYEGNYYYIKEHQLNVLPFEEITSEGTKHGAMCDMKITEMIKIPEELEPLISKEKYYVINDCFVAYIAN